MIAPGISTEMIPTTLSAGRRNPVDQLGLVGPQDKTEQSVLPGSDTKDVGTDPAGPVGPDVSVDQIQPVHEGPVGQYITRHPVGPDGMFSTCDSDQPMADGPVAGLSHVAQWVRTECFPCVIPISQWLMAQWASRLY